MIENLNEHTYYITYKTVIQNWLLLFLNSFVNLVINVHITLLKIDLNINNS